MTSLDNMKNSLSTTDGCIVVLNTTIESRNFLVMFAFGSKTVQNHCSTWYEVCQVSFSSSATQTNSRGKLKYNWHTSYKVQGLLSNEQVRRESSCTIRETYEMDIHVVEQRRQTPLQTEPWRSGLWPLLKQANEPSTQKSVRFTAALERLLQL